MYKFTSDKYTSKPWTGIYEKLESAMLQYFKRGWISIPVHLWYNPETGKKDSQLPKWRDIIDEMQRNRDVEYLIDLLRTWRSYSSKKCPAHPRRKPANGLAILTGEISNLTVLDFDAPVKKGLTWLSDRGIELYNDSLTFNTPNGQHIPFKYNPELKKYITSKAKVFGPDIPVDIRSDGGLIFAPPSVYMLPDGSWAQYTIPPPEKNPNGGIIKYKLHDFPMSIVKLLPKNETAETRELRESFLAIDELEPVLQGIVNASPDKRLDYDDWLRIISSVWSSFTYEESYPILNRVMPEESSGEYQNKYNNRLKDYSMGTVIQRARQCGVDLPDHDYVEVILGKDENGNPVAKKVKNEKVKYGKQKYDLNPVSIEQQQSKFAGALEIVRRLTDTKIETADNLMEEAEFYTPGDLYMLFGMPGDKKSLLLMDTAHRLSKGESIWNDTYTPKRPIKTLYFHADRKQSKFQNDYIPKLPDYDKNVLQYVYVGDLWRDNGFEEFEFDISKEETLAFVNVLIDSFKPDAVVFDSWTYCAPRLDFTDKEAVPVFMNYMKRLANNKNLIVWFVHHANKRNAKELRNTGIISDDYQGGRAISSALSASFIVNRSTSKEDPENTYTLTQGKTFSNFSNLKYVFSNVTVNGEAKVEFAYRDYDSTDTTVDSKPSETFQSDFISILGKNGYKISSIDLKKKMNVGTVISSASFYRYMAKLKDNGYIKQESESKSKTRNRIYELSQKAIDEYHRVESMNLDEFNKEPIEKISETNNNQLKPHAGIMSDDIEEQQTTCTYDKQMSDRAKDVMDHTDVFDNSRNFFEEKEGKK